MGRRRRRGLLAAALTLAAAACGTDADGTGKEDATCNGLAPYAVSGPYDVGVRTVRFDGAEVEVWYPAEAGSAEGQRPERYDLRDWMPEEYRGQIPDEVDVGFTTDAVRGLPPSTEAAPFPVVLFSHGLGGLRLQSSFLTTHLASWGMVVIAPEHVERNMTTVVWGQFSMDNAPQTHRALIARLDEVTEDAGLAGRVDRDRIAMTGHSQGGATVSLVGADPEVSAWVVMASQSLPMSSMDNDIRQRPGLVIGGTADGVSNGQERTQYDFLEAEDKRLVMVRDAGHMAFTDFCEIASDRGGVFQVALDHDIPIDESIAELVSDLVQDGCRPDDLPMTRAWPVVRNYVTAHLRYAFGEDDDAPLEASTADCFDPDVETLVHN